MADETLVKASADASSPGSPAADTGYLVVARRYRPKSFTELVGQEHVGHALANAIQTNRVGHAYLFTGARGVGKTSTARIFAKALNNPAGPDADPDQASDTAQAIDSGEDVDVIEIDGASNRGIDEIRSLRANVGVRPSRSRYKIYIIDEVHMLTGAAFNALLKTLEEPPEHVKFIFCTTEPDKIPITVLSRCQRFDFAPVEVTKIVGRLREIVTTEAAQADDQALELIARRAAGSMRDSQSLLEQVLSFSGGKLTADLVHQMLGTADDERLHALARSMADRDAAAALQQLDQAIDGGVDAGRLAEQLLGYFRDLMAVSVGCDLSMQRHTSASLHGELQQLGSRWGLQTVLAVVGMIDQTLVRIRHSVYSRVLLEATIIQICHLPDLQAIVDLAAAVTDLPAGARLTAAAPSPAIASAAAAQRTVVEEKKNAPLTEPTDPAAGGGSIATAASVAGPDPAATAQPQSPVAQTRTWTAAAINDAWNRSLVDIDPMTATLAQAVERVELIGEGGLKLVFAADSNLAMGRCDRPDHRRELMQSLQRHTGQEWQLTLVASATPGRVVADVPKTPGKSRVQRMRDVEANAWVQACIELFGAELVKVDVPA